MARAIGTFLFGYDSGIIASVISTEYDQFQLYFGPGGFDPEGRPNEVDPNITGAIVSVFAGGAFCMSLFLTYFHWNRVSLTLVGALLSGFTADKIGRKRTIQLGCLVAVVGMLFCT